MNATRVVRGTAVFVGVFLLASSITAITGVIPYSGLTPTFGIRLRNELLPVLVAVILLLPYRTLRSRAAREFGIVGIGITLFWGLRVAVPWIFDFFRGLKSWHLLPLSFGLLALLIANALAFRVLTGPVRSAG
jgi:hypothetical protein